MVGGRRLLREERRGEERGGGVVVRSFVLVHRLVLKYGKCGKVFILFGLSFRVHMDRSALLFLRWNIDRVERFNRCNSTND